MSYPREWDDKAPRLKKIAEWINERTTLFAEMERGFCNTDQKLAGTRLRRPGKGRRGTRLKVFECEAHKWELIRKPFHHFNRKDHKRKYPNGPLLDHNAAETYRCNSDVIYWLKRYLQDNSKTLKK